MDRITAIEKSLRAFSCGIIGLIPVLGLAPAIYAVICWAQVDRHYRQWNPASVYLSWGARLAFLSLLVSLLLGVLAIFIFVINWFDWTH